MAEAERANPTKTSTAQGGCLCGAIRYEIAKMPERLTICHCRFCQRSTGAAQMTQPALPATDITLLQGTPKRYTHISTGSGEAIHIHFCDTCGTKLYQTFDRFGGAAGLYSGTLDDPNWLTVPAESTKHIFVEEARHDTLIPAHVAVFSGHALAPDGTPLAPDTLDQIRRAGDL